MMYPWKIPKISLPDKVAPRHEKNVKWDIVNPEETSSFAGNEELFLFHAYLQTRRLSFNQWSH